MTKPEGKWDYENGCYIFREIKPCCPNSQRIKKYIYIYIYAKQDALTFQGAVSTPVDYNKSLVYKRILIQGEPHNRQVSKWVFISFIERYPNKLQ